MASPKETGTPDSGSSDEVLRTVGRIVIPVVPRLFERRAESRGRENPLRRPLPIQGLAQEGERSSTDSSSGGAPVPEAVRPRERQAADTSASSSSLSSGGVRLEVGARIREIQATAGSTSSSSGSSGGVPVGPYLRGRLIKPLDELFGSKSEPSTSLLPQKRSGELGQVLEDVPESHIAPRPYSAGAEGIFGTESAGESASGEIKMAEQPRIPSTSSVKSSSDKEERQERTVARAAEQITESDTKHHDSQQTSTFQQSHLPTGLGGSFPEVEIDEPDLGSSLANPLQRQQAPTGVDNNIMSSHTSTQRPGALGQSTVEIAESSPVSLPALPSTPSFTQSDFTSSTLHQQEHNSPSRLAEAPSPAPGAQAFSLSTAESSALPTAPSPTRRSSNISQFDPTILSAAQRLLALVSGTSSTDRSTSSTSSASSAAQNLTTDELLTELPASPTSQELILVTSDAPPTQPTTLSTSQELVLASSVPPITESVTLTTSRELVTAASRITPAEPSTTSTVQELATVISNAWSIVPAILFTSQELMVAAPTTSSTESTTSILQELATVAPDTSSIEPSTLSTSRELVIVVSDGSPAEPSTSTFQDLPAVTFNIPAEPAFSTFREFMPVASNLSSTRPITSTSQELAAGASDTSVEPALSTSRELIVVASDTSPVTPTTSTSQALVVMAPDTAAGRRSVSSPGLTRMSSNTSIQPTPAPVSQGLATTASNTSTQHVPVSTSQELMIVTPTTSAEPTPAFTSQELVVVASYISPVRPTMSTSQELVSMMSNSSTETPALSISRELVATNTDAPTTLNTDWRSTIRFGSFGPGMTAPGTQSTDSGDNTGGVPRTSSNAQSVVATQGQSSVSQWIPYHSIQNRTAAIAVPDHSARVVLHYDNMVLRLRVQNQAIPYNDPMTAQVGFARSLQVAGYLIHPFEIPFLQRVQAMTELVLPANNDLAMPHPLQLLAAQFLENFDNVASCDCVLNVRLPPDRVAIPVFIHTAALASCTKFRWLNQSLTSAERRDLPWAQDRKLVLNFVPELPRQSLPAMRAALHVLCGMAPRVALDNIRSAAGMQLNSAQTMMRTVQFYAAGEELGIVPVSVAATEAMERDFDFDNLEYFLSFALSGAVGLSDHDPTDNAFFEGHLLGTPFNLGNNVFGPNSQHLLPLVQSWMLEHFPEEFFFDAAAPPSYLLGAFHLRSDSAASALFPAPSATWRERMQFGDITRVNHEHGRLSTVLLSLPYAMLADLFARLHSEQGKHLAVGAVLEARNARTLALIKARAVEAGRAAPDDEITWDSFPAGVWGLANFPDRAKWMEVPENADTGLIARVWMPAAAMVSE